MSYLNNRRPRKLVYPPTTHDYLGMVEGDEEEVRGVSHEAIHDYLLAEARRHTPDATHFVCNECEAKFDA